MNASPSAVRYATSAPSYFFDFTCAATAGGSDPSAATAGDIETSYASAIAPATAFATAGSGATMTILGVNVLPSHGPSSGSSASAKKPTTTSAVPMMKLRLLMRSTYSRLMIRPVVFTPRSPQL